MEVSLRVLLLFYRSWFSLLPNHLQPLSDFGRTTRPRSERASAGKLQATERWLGDSPPKSCGETRPPAIHRYVWLIVVADRSPAPVARRLSTRVPTCRHAPRCTAVCARQHVKNLLRRHEFATPDPHDRRDDHERLPSETPRFAPVDTGESSGSPFEG